MIKHNHPKSKEITNAQLTKGLNFLWIELTLKCNLTCIHCYANSSPHQPLKSTMTTADWKKVILNARQEGCTALQFIGGEVTMYPELEEFIEYAHKIGYEFIEVFTNATLINNHWLKVFKEYEVNLASSFYSHDAATHDTITQRSGSFEKTLQGIKSLVAHQIPLRVGITEMTTNQGHVAEATHLLKTLGVNEISTDRLREVGRGHQSTSPAQVNELCGNCWKGKLCVTPSGNAYPCVFSRGFKVGNVKKQSINEIVHGQDLQKTRASLCHSFQAQNQQGTAFKANLNNNNECGPDTFLERTKNQKGKGDSLNIGNKCGPDTFLERTKAQKTREGALNKANECGPDRFLEKTKIKENAQNLPGSNNECGPDRFLERTKSKENNDCLPNIEKQAKSGRFLERIKPKKNTGNECGPDRFLG